MIALKMGIGSGLVEASKVFGDWLPRSPLMGRANLTQSNLRCGEFPPNHFAAFRSTTIPMEVVTPNATRRSTRIRVEIPVSVISLDRKRPFAEKCLVLIVSAQGCGFRSSRALQLETPIMLHDLPGGGSVTARVANCLPLGTDGKYFLVGASLYTHGNVWGIADAPADWNVVAASGPAPEGNAAAVPSPAAKLVVNKKVWPYNLFSEGAESHLGRK
jgi:hypothetical protein